MADSSAEVWQFRNERGHTSTRSPRTHCDLQSIRSLEFALRQLSVANHDIGDPLTAKADGARGFDTRDRNHGRARRIATGNLSGLRRWPLPIVRTTRISACPLIIRAEPSAPFSGG